MITPPWITVEPDGYGPGGWWYCECSAYDGEDTVKKVIRDGTEHGLACAKGKYRWERYADGDATRLSEGGG